MKKIVLIILVLILFVLGLVYVMKAKEDKSEISPVVGEQVEDTKSVVTKKSLEAVNLLKAKDWVNLSKYISKKNGVRFSPYTFVDVNNDKVFTADQISRLDQDAQVYTWGSYDGSGMPIELRFNDYYAKFVFGRDYTISPQVSYNEPIKTGNTVNNISEVYKDSVTMEYHIPMVDPQYEGLDWSSLKIVWQEEDGEWFIVGILNDSWTI